MRRFLAGLLALGIVAAVAADGAEVRELIANLQNADSDVRRAAARELGELGTEAQPAVPALSKALRDRDTFVRRYAAEALGKIGPGAKPAIGELSLLLNDERREVQLAAIDALGQMGPASIQALISAVKDPNKHPAIRRKAAQGLGRIGLPARGAVPALTDILTARVRGPKNNKGKTDDDIRPDVATALGKVARREDTAAIEALRALSEGKQRNRALKKAAGDALRQITGTGPKAKKKK
jgi:HEAT repeat protein